MRGIDLPVSAISSPAKISIARTRYNVSSTDKTLIMIRLRETNGDLCPLADRYRVIRLDA
jgi:hypothetical protein